MREKTLICPVCGKEYTDHPAVSRRNGEDICPECGQDEALEDARCYIAPALTDRQWQAYKESVKASSLKQGGEKGKI